MIERVNASSLPREQKYNILHELKTKRTQFNNALVEALAIDMRATVEPEHEVNPLFAMFMGDPDTFRMAIPGQNFGVQVTVANQAAESVRVRRISLEAPAGNWWSITALKQKSGTADNRVRQDSRRAVST